MARRRTTLESKQTGKEIESQEEIGDERTAGRGTALATPASWWEERKSIERPRAEEQERRYREEQEKYGQERHRGEYRRPERETGRRAVEEPKDIFRVWADSYSAVSSMWEDSYNNLYRPWVDSMLSLSRKMTELSRGEARPEAYKEFYNTWVSMYERAFDDFFKFAPGPLKSTMEPVKNTARIYMDMFTGMSDMWMRSVFGSASRA